MRFVLFALALTLAGAASPYRWSHALTGACTWRPRVSLRFVGTIYAPDRAAQAACWARKGLKSEPGAHVVVLAKWP